MNGVYDRIGRGRRPLLGPWAALWGNYGTSSLMGQCASEMREAAFKLTSLKPGPLIRYARN
eukprot:6570883-Prorocentrum_lima.AAC.1